MVVARAVYWPSSWALVSQLPGERGKLMGRLNSLTNFGQIAGTVGAGMIIAAWGFGAGFLTVAAMGLVAFACGLAFRFAPPSARSAPPPMLATYRMLLGRRAIYFGLMCAYLSALPFSLSISFFPLLLTSFDYSEGSSGLLLALRAVGSIAANLLVARFVRSGPQTLWPVVCGVIVAASIGFLPAWNHAVPIALCLLLVGAGSAAMTLYFQITISEASRPEERGSALALGGLGWSLSHFSTPLIMGVLADRYGLVTGFYVLGALALAFALAIAWARRWAFRAA